MIRQRCYDIVMHTPMGERPGWMRVSCEGERLSGELHLLSHTHPISGQIDAAGNCRFTGQIKTLMHTMHYTACGHLGPDEVSLALHENGPDYRVDGVARAEGRAGE